MTVRDRRLDGQNLHHPSLETLRRLVAIDISMLIGISMCWVHEVQREMPAYETEHTVMLILGLILLLLGIFLKVSILYTIGIILLVIGAVLWILGAVGRPVGGRKVWF
ncbi:hypothetical protein [Actinoplanes sp. NBRC 103695]|uniref:hypothetical protein n=2 Tax=Actinoplanes TaxID=1865 RepID=UPI0025572CAA|nr:hypothetical protein [Actinoplanes sp. NBRC 103695]